MRNRFEVDPKYTKTYKTVENLDKALDALGLGKARHILSYTADGRVTAVFVGDTWVANCALHAGFAWVY